VEKKHPPLQAKNDRIYDIQNKLKHDGSQNRHTSNLKQIFKEETKNKIWQKNRQFSNELP
jgi:hypothetical protein